MSTHSNQIIIWHIVKVKIIITASTYKAKYLANIKLFKFEMLLIRKKMFGQHPVAR